MLYRVGRGVGVQNYAADLVVQSAIVLPVVLATSAVFFLAVERPCMDPAWATKVRRRLTRRPSPA
jgi:hypothetical protein